ncbi:MAG: archease [Terriglobia bacterium]
MRRAKGRRGKGTSREAKKKPGAKKKIHRRALSKPYEFLDHPADVGFVARGKSLAELFAAAALAMCAYGWELDTVRARQAIEIRVRAATVEDLLYSWLSEVLFLSDAEGWVFKQFTVSRVEAIPNAHAKSEAIQQALWEVRGMGRGERFDRRHHRARTYIKAVTYHQLGVEPRNGKWQATVYLDV